MKFKIHRGTREIGGSCLEVWTEGTRIVIDIGMPLVNPDRTRFDSRSLELLPVDELISRGILPDIAGLYDESGSTALLISHAHQDHFGLMRYIDQKCSVYLGRATLKLIEITGIITRQNWKISSPRFFESGETFTIGDIEITPYLVDHSAFDSYAFLVRAGGRSLFYSGDFRLHGRKGRIFEWFRHNITGNVDYLVMEGTTIGRQNGGFLTESEIEEEFVNTFESSRGINMVYASGQNIDRLVSIFRACRRTGRIFAVDFYIANVLKDLSEFARLPYPSKKNFPEVRVFFPNRLSRMISSQGKEKIMYRFRHFKITWGEIDEMSSRTVMLVRPSMVGDLDRLKNLEGGTFVYSMWNGYRKEKSTREFIERLLGRGMSEKSIHTSGHADRKALQELVRVLKPGCIVPIHTFDGDLYREVFQGTEVLRVKDREIVSADG